MWPFKKDKYLVWWKSEAFRHSPEDSMYNPCSKCVAKLTKENLVQIIGFLNERVAERDESIKMLDEILRRYEEEAKQ